MVTDAWDVGRRRCDVYREQLCGPTRRRLQRPTVLKASSTVSLVLITSVADTGIAHFVGITRRISIWDLFKSQY